MKFEQLIMVLIIINLGNIIVGYSIQSNSITDLETDITGWLENDNTGLLIEFDGFGDKVRDENNWFLNMASDIVQGMTSALNLVLIGFQITLLALFLWITPARISRETILNTSESISILRIVGLIGYTFIQWINITTIIRLYKLRKGSDQ